MSDHTFKTSDLWLSAFFRANNLKMIRTEKDSHSKVIFIFESPERCQKLYMDYVNDSHVGILTIRSQIDTLKNIVFNRP